MFKMMKVFDCQHMPLNVRRVFFEEHQVDNDVAISYTVERPEYENSDGDLVTENEYFTIVDQWLLDNGAASAETVMIKHWW